MSDNTKFYNNIFSPSGSEEMLVEEIKKELLPFCDKIYTDNLGNLIAHKSGDLPKLVLSACMDEPGVIALTAQENGFLKVAALGNLNTLYCLGQRVTFLNGVSGIIFGETDDNDKCPDIGSIYVDIGAKTREEAAALVPISTPAFFHAKHFDLNGKVTGHGIASRSACRIIIDAVKSAEKVKNDIYIVFTSKARLPDSGVKPAVFGIEPDYFIAVEPVSANDTPKGKEPKAPLGSGIYIKAQEKKLFYSQNISDRISDVAQALKIKFNTYLSKTGTSLAEKAQFLKGGAFSGAVSFGVRYIDTPYETISTDDIADCTRLMTALLNEGIQ